MLKHLFCFGKCIFYTLNPLQKNNNNNNPKKQKQKQKTKQIKNEKNKTKQNTKHGIELFQHMLIKFVII